MPLSMDSFHMRQGVACFSLKLGSILSGLITILYSVLLLAQYFAASDLLPSHYPDDFNGWMICVGFAAGVLIHILNLFLSTLMVVGVLRERATFIKPWLVWTSTQVMALIILFMFTTTMAMVDQNATPPLLVYVVEFLGIMIRVYMVMVVMSYYKQVLEENEEYERLKQLFYKDWYSSTA